MRQFDHLRIDDGCLDYRRLVEVMEAVIGSIENKDGNQDQQPVFSQSEGTS